MTGSYDAQTGILTLSGPATTPDFEAALQSVTYVHAGDDPDASREIAILVTDADGLETERTLIVNITAVNDAPVEDTNAVIAVNEGGSTLLSSAELLYTDPDNTAAELTYTIDGLPAHGRLELDGTALVLGGTFTQDDIDSGRLAYVHDGSETTADSFAFTVSDPIDGVLAGRTATIEVTPVNDAPVLTAILSASVARNGTLHLVSRYAASDADNDTLDVTLVATHGTITLASTAGLTFATGDGDLDDTLVFSGLIADINAALADLTFRPTAGYNGSASIAVTLDDGDETASHTTAITVLPPGTPGGGDTIGGDVVTSSGTITMGPNAHNAILTGTADAAVYGNALDNAIQGNAGNNFLRGGAGDDSIRGAAGDDIVYGNEGEDVIYGNEGADILFGGQDADSVFGGQGSDAAYGNLANDVVYGNLGDDALYGGQGDDVLYGGQGDDHLFGNKGDDVLYAGDGDDTLTGGEGADSFVIQAGNHVTVTDFTAGEDVLSFLFDTAGAVFVDDGNGNALYDDGMTQVLLIGVDAATDGLIPMG